MDMCRKINFEERPDYDRMRSLFKELFYSQGFEYDYNFDWIIKQRADKLKMLKQKLPTAEAIEISKLTQKLERGSNSAEAEAMISPRSDRD